MNPQQNFWKVVTTVGILLAVFLAVVSIKQIKSIAYVGRSEQILNTISVNGKGEIVTQPDVATFSFSVTETAKNVGDAQKAATDKTNAALKVVRDAGIEDKDIQTVSYTINPHYEYQQSYCPAVVQGGMPVTCRPSKNVLTGYDVSQSVQIKVRDLSKAGSLFSSIGALGVQNVNGLTFAVDDVEKVKAEARSKAIQNAQSKAQELAKQLGVKLVRITSFYENGDFLPYGMGGAMSLKAEANTMAAPEIPTGEQKVTNNVTITYEIR